MSAKITIKAADWLLSSQRSIAGGSSIITLEPLSGQRYGMGVPRERPTSARELPTTTAADRTFFFAGAAGRGGGPGRGPPSAGGGSSPDPLLLKSLRPFCGPKSLNRHRKDYAMAGMPRSSCHGVHHAEDSQVWSAMLWSAQHCCVQCFQSSLFCEGFSQAHCTIACMQG